DRLVRMPGCHLFVQFETQSWLGGQIGETGTDYRSAAIEQVEDPLIALRRVLLDRGGGSRGVDVQGCHGADRALRVVRGHFNAPGLRENSDLLQLQNAARLADIRLDIAHQVTRTEIRKSVLRERAFAGRERYFGLVAQ